MKPFLLALLAGAPVLVCGADTTPASDERPPSPVVLLKLDDLTPKNARPGAGVSENFQSVLDILRREGVKASFGVICNSMESAPPAFFDWIRAARDEGIASFWNHGYTHVEKPRVNGRRVTEFHGPSLEEQTESLVKGQRLFREKCGFDLTAFGAPFNQTDATTAQALAACPEIRTTFFGPSGAKDVRNLERTMNLETPVFQPNAAKVAEDFESFGKSRQYLVLQGHPNSWGGKQRAEFANAIRYLKAQGCTFMTPDEFLAVPLRATPAPPKSAANPKPSREGGLGSSPAHASYAVLSEPEPGRPQLLENPTLRDTNGDGLPEGWHLSTGRQGHLEKLDATTAGGPARAMRLRVDVPAESVILQQFRALPDGAADITVAARVRWSGIARGAKGFMQGAVQLVFQDAKGNKVGDFLSPGNFLGTSDGWRIVGGTFPRPSGAVRLRVQLALYAPKAGTLDVAWVTAAPGPVPAAPAAEELSAPTLPTSAPAEALARPGMPGVGDGPEYGGVRGFSLLGKDAFDTLRPFRNTDKFDCERFAVGDMPFTNAVRVTVRERVPAAWDMQLRGKGTGPIAKGDRLLLTYWMRGLSTETEFAEAWCVNALQLDREPWTAVFTFRPHGRVGAGWTKFQKVVVSRESFDTGSWAFNFQFGLDPQSFEIGGLTLYNYGPDIDPALLPSVTEPPYRGSEPDAPWRAAARERIERIRKGNLAVRVLDAGGHPVSGATVRVEMTRHAFGWGSAVNAWGWSDQGPDGERYRKAFLELFNLLVPENGLKWPSWENPAHRKATLRMLDWALEHGCELRGHTLVWPSFRRNPQLADRGIDGKDKDALRKAVSDHIAEIMAATRGKIRAWDVMNEPNTNHEFMDILGNDIVADWWKLARSLDPKPQLFLNENQILAGTKLHSTELWLDRLVAAGAPLGGIGIQGHVGVGTAAPEQILETFDRLAKYGVPLSITELDINTSDADAQAQYLHDILLCAFSHPAVDSVTFWGFWDGRHWLSNTPLYAKDWSEKPGLRVFRDLVLGEWWTRDTVRTDAAGRATLRGFLGDYRLEALDDAGAPIAATDGTLPPEGATLTLRLP